MLTKLKAYMLEETKFTRADKLTITLAHVAILLLIIAGIV